MISRSKKIKLFQLFLISSGTILIFLTYVIFKPNLSEKIISDQTKSIIDDKIKKEGEKVNTFYDIEYSGIDLSGNRYILKAKEASDHEKDSELINLKFVNAVFYFEDNKTLNVSSDYGQYNNKTLDMTFKNSVKGRYDGSELFADQAKYSNSESYILISNNVKIKDFRGTMFAEKIMLDIDKNKLNISSSGENKVNANLNYK